ncbi:SpoIIE family protein phosphatase [candidate division KSB1 bacterium]|nr:SpoIIE family protein phosphatase [candidate division KSB1 bacterium]
MRARTFKIALVILAALNLTCAFTFAFLLFQRVTDENIFEDLEPGQIIVIYIAPGGASDRAGLRLDDVIIKINHQSFNNKHEADAIMSANPPGSIVQYDILRNDQPMVIDVQLARIKVPLYQLLFMFGGLLLLALGLFVGFKRPLLHEARLYATSLVCLFMILFVIGDIKMGSSWLFEMIKIYAMITVVLGMALSSHAHIYFPVRKFADEKNNRLARYYYYLALVAMLITLVLYWVVSRFQNLIVSALFTYLILILPVSIISLGRRAPEYIQIRKKTTRWMKWGFGLFFLLGILMQRFFPKSAAFLGWFALIILLVPVHEIYLILKYRIFGIYLVIKRSGLYRLVNIIFVLLTLLVFILLINLLSIWEINLPTIYYHQGSLEFLWLKDVPAAKQLALQKAAALAFGIGLTFFLSRELNRFRIWLDRKFYREKYDYRQALSEFLNVQPEALEIDTFFQIFIDRLTHRMRLKGAVLLYHQRVIAARGIELDSKIDFKTLVLNDTQPFPVTHFEPLAQRAILQELGIEFIVPILAAENQLIAVLFCGEKLSESNFNQEDVEFLTAITNYLLITLRHLEMQGELQEKQRIENELFLARKIQRDSLPHRDPEHPRLEIASFAEPAWEVGGDYFDYFPLNNANLGVVIGDVSGKGTSAALYVAKIQGMMRLLFHIHQEPKALFQHLNEILYRDIPRQTFFTAVVALFEDATNELHFVRAGHTPMLYYNAAQQTVQSVMGTGLGLGLVKGPIFNAKLQSLTLHYQPQDVFLLYTDGVADMMNEYHEFYGEAAIEKFLELYHHLTAAEIRQKIIEDLWRFKGEHQQHDDLTLIVIKVKA